ncbi:Golgi-associated PDZ and coiled-coil motif-containing protein-like [Anthonomus grandis grandis]|uniref:Golgi-associated PDZ and coiled-coil motif-containing protein-like n=1 Tax=Anthonomus grandis grandis TaxID=2921223 RepID=UPI002165D00F|nr:Golgi-associated PDZ and coiled-coil motif-containing protein-like [Anthonomus grandis grandis]
MASIGFRWLDILEKEFDKAFVDLDLSLGDIGAEEATAVFNARQKLCTLGSCFAQLSHKSQTIFQNSAKLEAELIHLRAELIDSKSKKELLENELHNLLLQLHSNQLSQLPDSLGSKKADQHFKPDVNAIKRRLEAEIRQSPFRLRRTMSDSKETSPKETEVKFSQTVLEPIKMKVENSQLLTENTALRNDILALTAEVYGAKLAAKYLDKELAGRIQQLQLLGKEMRGEIRDKLWSQLESEILLQRHKTVVRACRRNSALNYTQDNTLKTLPEPNSVTDHFGDIRVVVVKRKPEQGLGISITGGREHGVPILISELEPNGPAAMCEQLYIGDAILFVNDIDLRNACHKEAVSILQQQNGDCVLQVQYIAADDSDNSLEEDGLNFRFFHEEVCGSSTSSQLKDSQEIVNTPTAPRTPESNSNLGPTSVLDNTNNGNSTTNLKLTQELEESVTSSQNNNISLPDNITKFSDNLSNVDTTDLVLLDNATNNIIKLEHFKKVDVFATMESNFNCSANSLISDNLSSPMQTSTDVYLDSEILSTDVASNDSHSPKNLQVETAAKNFKYENNIIEIEKINEFPDKQQRYESSESLSRVKSDQSLLNSDESEGSSPVHKHNKSYKKQKKVRKKYFGVKTLQSIFNKHDGYSDISTTASELGEEASASPIKQTSVSVKLLQSPSALATLDKPKPTKPLQSDTAQHFDEHVHSIIQDIFAKSQIDPTPILKPNKPNLAAPKKYFSLHGQNLRVGKALRLCPNEESTETAEQDQRKEKLLARYVYNANCLNVDGVGDPDFGTPV